MIVPVKRVTVVSLTEFEDYFLTEIGDLGVVELRKLKADEYKGLKEVANEEEVARYSELYGRFRLVYKRLSSDLRTPKEVPKEATMTKIPLEELEATVNEFEKEASNLEQLEEAKPMLKILKEQKIDPKGLGDFEHIFVKAGTVSAVSLPKLEEVLKTRKDVEYKISALSESRSFLHVGGLLDAKEVVNEALAHSDFKELKLPAGIPEKIDDALPWVEREITNAREVVTGILIELSYGRRVKYSLDITRGVSKLLRSRTVSVMSGWTRNDALKDLNAFFENAKGKVKGRMAVYYEDPVHEEEVPTVMRNPKVLEPYEILTRQYGIPEYKELDPTSVFGILWTVMFGIMFPDAGQGIAILVMGLLFSRMRRKALGINFRKIGKLMIGLGISAIIFGLLSGEFFLYEMEPLLPGLVAGWAKDPGYIVWLIKIGIFFGIAAMMTGFIFNIVNEFKKGEKLEALLGEKGLAGLIIFMGLVFLAFHFIGIVIVPGALSFPSLPSGTYTNAPGLGMSVFTNWSFALLLIGIVMLPVKSVLAKEGVATSIGPIIEDSIGFFGNIMSFARIAGFCMAHAAFGLVVHDLMVVSPALGIGIGYIFLNVFCLTLEMLVVMIQALRLLYYEFATKFFKGTGFAYSPFKL